MLSSINRFSVFVRMYYICHYCFRHELTKNSYITLKIPFELYGHTMVPNVLVPPRSLEIRRGPTAIEDHEACFDSVVVAESEKTCSCSPSRFPSCL
jgi:hypothetical protein